MSRLPSVSPDQIRDLREVALAPYVACRQALSETGGDLERALDLLHQRGLAQRPREFAPLEDPMNTPSLTLEPSIDQPDWSRWEREALPVRSSGESAFRRWWRRWCPRHG